MCRKHNPQQLIVHVVHRDTYRVVFKLVLPIFRTKRKKDLQPVTNVVPSNSQSRKASCLPKNGFLFGAEKGETALYFELNYARVVHVHSSVRQALKYKAVLFYV